MGRRITVDPSSYFPFPDSAPQLVQQRPFVGGIMHYKRPLASFLSPYARHHMSNNKKNVLRASLNKIFPSFHAIITYHHQYHRHLCHLDHLGHHTGSLCHHQIKGMKC